MPAWRKQIHALHPRGEGLAGGNKSSFVPPFSQTGTEALQTLQGDQGNFTCGVLVGTPSILENFWNLPCFAAVTLS